MKRTPAQIAAWRVSMNSRPRIPWNKGKTYVHASKAVYANKGAWNKAMRRLFQDRCMRCGWGDASCDTHHITPRSKGGQYTLENGVILCPNCHRLADFGFLTHEQLSKVRNAGEKYLLAA